MPTTSWIRCAHCLDRLAAEHARSIGEDLVCETCARRAGASPLPPTPGPAAAPTPGPEPEPELEDGTTVFLSRSAGASVFETSRAFRISAEVRATLPDDGEGALAAIESEWIRSGDSGAVARLGGFDTYWYVWAPENDETRILR